MDPALVVVVDLAAVPEVLTAPGPVRVVAAAHRAWEASAVAVVVVAAEVLVVVAAVAVAVAAVAVAAVAVVVVAVDAGGNSHEME